MHNLLPVFVQLALVPVYFNPRLYGFILLMFDMMIFKKEVINYSRYKRPSWRGSMLIMEVNSIKLKFKKWT